MEMKSIKMEKDEEISNAGINGRQNWQNKTLTMKRRLIRERNFRGSEYLKGKKDDSLALVSKAKRLIESSGKNAVALLFEFCQQKYIAVPEIIYTSNGSIRRPTFRAQARFGTLHLSFSGNHCNTKREAKASCCLIALDYFLQRECLIISEPSTSSISASTCNYITQISNDNSYTIFERFAATIFSHVAAKCHAYSHSEESDKVRAGVFMVDAYSKQCFLISWATGSKCIGGNYLNLHGEVVNDCHAEILSRRGLLRFLYQQIKVFKRNESASIFVSKKGKLAVRPNLSFHLFINTAPCGDGRVFAFSSEKIIEVAEKLSRKRWEAVDFREGTVLVPDIVQTYDGIQGAERLRTMSCSDKILKWNILGLQGCLLSSLMQPIYFSSISIEHLFHFAHLSRSLCCRLGAYVVPEPFLLHHPHLATCYKTMSRRNSTKTSLLAANWNISDGTVEIINAQTGQIQDTCKPSRLCKRNMFRSYRSVLKLLSSEENKGVIPMLSSSYLEVKNACKDYIVARDHFFQALIDNGAGKWLKKPIEEKMFYVTE
uniref:A to I editase domain-containing protein n=1 Tax=Setaria digitata TaxID=48799 RepID=A0A915PS05_9BILA